MGGWRSAGGGGTAQRGGSVGRPKEDTQQRGESLSRARAGEGTCRALGKMQFPLLLTPSDPQRHREG